MAEHMRTDIKVGLFSLVGLTLFCLSIILLGGDKWFLTRTYLLKLRMPQVQGLGRGSVVTLTGVQVGNIDDIKFVEGANDVEVTLSLEMAVQKRITEGSRATIKTQGALGDKFVFIEPGPPTAPPIAAGGRIDLDRTPDLFDVIAQKGAEFGEIVEVIKEVRKLFENINRDGRSARMMENLAVTSGELNKLSGETREALKFMRQETLQPLASILKKIDNGQGTLGALINDPSLHNRLSAFMGEAPRNRFLKPLLRESIQTNEGQK